jgi:hypothetical protein
MYKDLRSKIVHNYSGNKVYALGKDNELNHLSLLNNKIYLDVTAFVADLDEVFGRYKKS